MRCNFLIRNVALKRGGSLTEIETNNNEGCRVKRKGRAGEMCMLCNTESPGGST